MTRISRRDLLRGLSLSAAAGALSVATRRSRSIATDSTPESAGESEFEPAVHGFGFENFSTPPTVPDPSEFVSEDEFRARLAAHLNDAIPGRSRLSASSGLDRRIGAIADELFANATRVFGTEGYCYGMATAARRYFEEPESVPVDRDRACEITHVNAPLDDPSTPVRDDIEWYQREQFTDLGSWIRRWPLLRPSRIDYRSQARALCNAIDEFGTAGVTITGENVLAGHYVLLYEYEVAETRVTFDVYDPNEDAAEYAATGARRLGIDTDGGEPLLESYAGTYDRFLYSGTDRNVLVRAGSD